MADRTSSYLKFREEVLERYNHKCANCGSQNDLQIYHIVPVAIGGTDAVSNLVPLCHSCHMAAHHGRDITEYQKESGTSNGGRKLKLASPILAERFNCIRTAKLEKQSYAIWCIIISKLYLESSIRRIKSLLRFVESRRLLTE